MATLLLRLIEMVDIPSFNFVDEILHCASIVHQMSRPLSDFGSAEKFDPLYIQKFITNRKNPQGILSSRYANLRVEGHYNPAIDLNLSFELTISDVTVDPYGYNKQGVDYPEYPFFSKGSRIPCNFVDLFQVEDFYEPAFEFCLRYLKSRQNKQAVVYAAGTSDDNMYLSYSELFYLWERFKGKEMEAYEWFLYGWPEIVKMRETQSLSE